MSKWIPCNEKLPDINAMEKVEDDDRTVYASGVVLIYTKYGYYALANPMTDLLKEKVWFEDYNFVSADYEVEEVLAWMPFPEPWEGEDE